jgi:hypothetical protein
MTTEQGKEKEQAQGHESKDVPSTPDAIEAAEKEHDEAQAEAMEDLLAEDGLAPSGKAPDQKPEDAKQKDEGRSAEAKKEDDETPEKTPEKESKKEPDPTKAAPPEDAKSKEQRGDLENLYEVKGPEGDRLVKASDLVKTYQQFSSLQQQHLSLKPLIDLSREAQVPLNQIHAYAVFGIKKAYEQAKGITTTPASSGDTKPAGDAYAGPFGSAEDDAYMKESDPKIYNSMWTMYRHNQELKNALTQFQGRLTAREKHEVVEQEKSVKEQLDDLVGNFVKGHEGYFKDETLKNFKGFLGQKYADVAVADIDLQFLNSALMHFDPTYFATYFAQQAKTEQDKKREEERAGFGESGDVRGTTVTPQLTEQQEHMADML